MHATNKNESLSSSHFSAITNYAEDLSGDDDQTAAQRITRRCKTRCLSVVVIRQVAVEEEVLGSHPICSTKLEYKRFVGGIMYSLGQSGGLCFGIRIV